MKVRKSAIAIAAAALISGGIVATAATASADEFKFTAAHSSGTCDTATGEWVVDWQVTNNASLDATLSDVESVPADSPIADLPSAIAANATVHGTQRLAGTGSSARISYKATWTDGASLVNNWDFRPVTPCTKLTYKASWPILDAAGNQRSTMSYNSEGQTLMACYGGPAGDIIIEARTGSGQVLQRAVPEFGCAVAIPYAGTGRFLSVRAVVGDFANEWHDVP
jgi:hypothetical protein